MSLYFRYGNYSHAAGECQLSISRVANRGQDGLAIIGYTTRYVLDGVLSGSGVSDLNGKILALENAYSVNGKNFGLYDSSTGQTTHWVSASQQDVRVVEITFPLGTGAEYVTGRTYHIVIETRSGLLISGLYDFTETVTISGGGPRIVWLEILNGPPRKQITALQTLCVVTQQGRAASASTYPVAPGPLFPGALMEAPVVTYSSPQVLDTGRRINYQTQWSYIFGLAQRVNARPHSQ